MTITKGTRLVMTRKSTDKYFADMRPINDTLVYEVTKVNSKTYSIKCVEGYMKGTGAKLLKSVVLGKTTSDEYGTMEYTWNLA